MSGYSGTPLTKKLGLKNSLRTCILNAPQNYFLEIENPPNVHKDIKKGERFDFIQYFARTQTEIEKVMPMLASILEKCGVLWISWPKKGAQKITPSDLDENIIREIGLKRGMVDVKVCAINDIWSGLKFVFRLKDR